MSTFVQQLLVMLAALAFVCVLAYAVLGLLRGRPGGSRGKANGSGADDALRFVRALPLGARERVVLVEHRGERWMLGVTPGGINVLARWPLDGLGPPGAAPPATQPGPPATAGNPSCGRP